MALESGVSGFTILRSVAGFDYPIGESLRSLLPLVDEIVVVTHRGDTAAREAIHALGDARLDVVETDWN